MDVWQITVAALRRWYVFLPLLALTAIGAVTVGEGVANEYEVRATAILVPGTETSEIESPYGSMDTTNMVLAIVLDDAAVRQSVADEGLKQDYEVRPRTRSRIMDVIVLSESPETSLATGQAVLDLASQELADRQGEVGIPPNAQISLQVLQAPSVTEVVAEGKLRNMAVVGILGGALSLLAAVLFDDIVGLIRRWRSRRRQDKSEARHGEPAARAKVGSVPTGAESETPDGASDTTSRLENGRLGEDEPERARVVGPSGEPPSDVTREVRPLTKVSRES